MRAEAPEKFWAFVTGQSGVPKEILDEVNRQRDCLLRGILIEPGVGPSLLKALRVDPQSSRQAISRARRGRLLGWVRRKLQRSHYRSAKTQAAIWKNRLTKRGEEETLRTSSAPGTSRHHWGTDIDVFETDSKKFRRRGPYHSAYVWMQKNASRFGFFQPYQGEGGRGISYIEERWHWSYGPIAEPLLKIVGEHILGYERNLIRVWRSYEKRWNEKRRIKEPFFSHAEEVWRHFVFNVSEGGFLWGAPGENKFNLGTP
jgi:hypothetical protein